MKKLSLKSAVAHLEDSIITLSGPALALSGIIAGLDLVTGGNFFKTSSWLVLVWAITLLCALDFQVLALGVRAHRVYVSQKSTKQKVFEIVLAVFIAAAVSYVSIQMQSIIARVNAENVTIDLAAAQLGVNTVALIWERSTLVLVLIFMSGWLREHDTTPVEACPPAPVEPAPTAIPDWREMLQEFAKMQQVTIERTLETVMERVTITQIAQNEQLALPGRTRESDTLFVANSQGEQGEQTEQSANTGERVRTALTNNPHLTDRELADIVGVAPSTANKWRKRVEQAA